MQVDMDKIMRHISIVFEAMNSDDERRESHLTVCDAVCTKFFPATVTIPTWVCYVVTGYMRDEGWSR